MSNGSSGQKSQQNKSFKILSYGIIYFLKMDQHLSKAWFMKYSYSFEKWIIFVFQGKLSTGDQFTWTTRTNQNIDDEFECDTLSNSWPLLNQSHYAWHYLFAWHETTQNMSKGKCLCQRPFYYLKSQVLISLKSQWQSCDC